MLCCTAPGRPWQATPSVKAPAHTILGHPFGSQCSVRQSAIQITTKDRPAVGVGDALDPRRWTGAPALLTDVPPATAVGPRPEHCSTALDLWTPKISAATALRGAGSSKGGGVGGGSDVHFTSDHRLPPSGISASPFYLGTTLENPTAVDLAIVTAEAKAKKEALYAQDVWPWLLAAAVAGKAAPPAPAPVGDLEAVQAEAGATVPPWTPRQLQRRINASIAAGVASLTMPAGDYFFDGSLVIAGASGFELRVAGGVARLWFEIGHGLLVDACDDVAVSGPFELDYTTGAHFQGTVLIVQGPSVYVRTERGWLDPDVFMAKHGHLTTSESTFGVRWTKASGLTDYVSDSTVQDEQPEKVGPGLFRYPKSAAGGLPAAVAGDKITVRIRAGYTLHTHNSSRVVYSDLKIHGSTFMAITEFGGRGGHRYQNVKVARRSSVPAANGTAMCAGRKRSCAGLIASNADAFHSSACRDGPHLDNVELSYCLDDFINVHTRVQAVGLRRPPATVGGGERLVLLDPRLSRDAGLPNDAPYGTAETLQNLRPGDNVTFYQINTLKKLATRTVASATRVLDVAAGAALAAHFSKTVNLPPDDANPPVLDCDVCGLPATAVHGNQGRSNVTENCPAGYSRAWHVELTAGQAPLPPNVTNNTLVQIEGWDASGAVVENCHFHDSDFGFRWKSSGSKIINSVIGGSRIEISPLQLYLEGALEVHSVQISGNTFTKLDAMSEPNESGCTGSTSSYAPGTCSGIVLTNNSFQPPPPSVAHITTTSAMRDHAGAPITDCLEPHIQKFGNTFYAYGFTIRNQSEQFATTIYSSEDMVTWSKRAYIPVNKTLDGPVYGEAVALWYVVYNPKTKLYMGYGANYGKWINVYRSTAPTGPFVYMHRFSKVYPYTGVGESTGAGDILIYTEGDSAYLIYNSMPMSTKWSGQHRFAYIYKLNAAWDDILVDTLTNTTAVMEGLWLFKRQGTYFLLGSHLSGYRSNDNFYLTAKSITGPWTHRGLLAPKGTNTYGSQTFQGLTISGSKGEAFIYIGHRYLPCGPQPGNCSGPFTNASNIWLPLDFSGDLLDTPLQYRDEWNLDLDGAWTK